jgi:formylglycine-generating enzyme required for sulfatase activity
LYDPAWEQPQRTITLPDYWIGKYPVTVGGFRAFVEAGGYREKKWWTQSGWQEREKEKWTAPRFWDDSQWTANDGLPVVGVSWYEAYAYCSWLAEWTGKPYRLPGDAEWEKAARGTEGGIYPWGNEWRAGVCNTREAGIGHTTPVDRFSPAGDSPYRAADMIGNVWEWCLAKWCKEYADPEAIDPEGDSRRCLRGGAWGDNGDYARAAVRSWFVPGGRYYDRGFRVAVSAPV